MHRITNKRSWKKSLLTLMMEFQRTMQGWGKGAEATSLLISVYCTRRLKQKGHPPQRETWNKINSFIPHMLTCGWFRGNVSQEAEEKNVCLTGIHTWMIKFQPQDTVWSLAHETETESTKVVIGHRVVKSVTIRSWVNHSTLLSFSLLYMEMGGITTV